MTVRRILRASVSVDGRSPPLEAPTRDVASRLDGLGEAAAFHGVAGYVLDAWGGTDLLPPAERDVLEAARTDAALTHLATLADLAHLREVMDSAGVPWLVVKGPVLAELVHDDPMLRYYTDLDVLVDPHRLADALTALEAGGGTILDRNWTLIRQEMLGELNVALPTGTHLDLHWHLLNSRKHRQLFRLDPSDLLARVREVEIAGLTVPTLDPVDSVIYVAMHTMLSGGHRLIWLKDLERLCTREPPPEDGLVHRARDVGAELLLAAALDRTRRAIGGPRLDISSQLRRRARTFVAAADRVWQLDPAERQDGAGSPSRMVARALSDTPGRSVRSLAAKSLARLRRIGRSDHPEERGCDDPADPRSLQYESGGDPEREAFLAAVGAEQRGAGASGPRR